MKDAIIDYIKRNRVSTTEVADCLGKQGVLPDVLPLNQGQFRVGPIKWVYAYNESNWDVHDQVRNIEKDSIVFIEAFNCGERAIIGELVSKFILLYQQAKAIITTGKMRDAHKLIKENYPIWCKGVTPIGCFNRKNDLFLDQKIINEHKEMYDGALAVCDDSGVVIIPKKCLTKDFLDKLKFIEQQEDIWFDCLNRKKWDTFRIVCQKEYLNENN